MILFMLGTQNNSFHRLLEKIDKLIEEKKIQDKVIVQAGYTKYESKNMKIFGLIPEEELERYQEQADLIIPHGAVGSIISSLQNGKKVIAVPRLHKYGEHVNDHQKEIVETYNKKGYIIGVKGVGGLEKALTKVKDFEPKPLQSNNQKMLNLISDFIDRDLGDGPQNPSI